MRDLVIIGAGPAGLSAAATAHALGLDTLILDEQPSAGGQIYRNVERVTDQRPADLAFLGRDYAHGRTLARAASAVDRRQGATVWHIGPMTRTEGRQVVWSEEGKAQKVNARAVLLATGAMERPVPIPGWTLPGVTTVGALQTVLKQSGIFPRGRVVLAGSGPLLMLLASQYFAAGIRIEAILDTTPPGGLNRAMLWLPLATVGARRAILKGRRLRAVYGRAAREVWRGVTGIRAEGDGALQTVRFTDASGVAHEIAADALALHEGVIPNPQLPRLVEAVHDWDPRQRCFRPVLDAYGASSASGVYVAGDGGGILGAEAAEASGRVAAATVALGLGRIAEAERDLRAAPDLNRLTGQRWLRRFLDAMFPPPDWIGRMADATTVCRCEEVRAADIRKVADHAQGPNQLKAYTRAGMGPCQGRMCGHTVTEVLAEAKAMAPGAVGYYHIRPPAKPVTVEEMAALVE
ncbi:NAD(P)/FAD-dependent oxidoreductase [Thalassobaculum litoreum]|uniref:NADPH-dependent 2,4-dienoyl-CoA reductase, sulfur reductase n=1 Tax=Thalassobaculum litoreum DSM 18839 TaxID=1123362 RepID=A0A8G2BMR8_9PROT|nr:FAD/NAD(P)-binding oxidoreductase [Thalassobaculum litoreum]SDG28200.1 NADPH-dependent 2,4-dienoyl-CoA reductase, sulfur reductase [Thalassobaculum litoreum DSM 18839]